ncbi:MAG: MFS transporter [Firmicutes bacterium HGW-Firmicutes-14]|nr:MAG: MFS transporter [Firmicutes bacterium HGW-Firmicutes-14]
MTYSAKQDLSLYRWVILSIMWATIFIGVVAQFQMAALAYRIIPGLKLTLSQFSMILSAPMLSAVFLSLPAGALADRFGVKKTVAIGFVFSTIGIYFRYAAHDFLTLFVLMFLSGISCALLNANAAKLLGAWFPVEQMGTAMGIYLTGPGLGMTVALAATALFPSIKRAYIVAGIINLTVGILWVTFVNGKPAGAPEMSSIPVTKCLGTVGKSKNVWLVGLALMLFMGSNMAFNGNISNALNGVRGIDPKIAGLMASLVTLGTVSGSFVGPLLSDRIGRIKPFLAPIGIFGAIIMYLSWVTSGVASWILLAVLGFLMGTGIPLLMAFPMLLPEIGPKYAGTAGGLIATLQLIGAFAIPSFIIAPIAGTNFNTLFLLASVSYLLFGIVTVFLPEMGAKARAKAGASSIRLGI